MDSPSVLLVLPQLPRFLHRHNAKAARGPSIGTLIAASTTGSSAQSGWEKLCGRQFDLMFDDELDRFRTDLVFTFGGSSGDIHRRARARRRGVGVVAPERRPVFRHHDQSIAGEGRHVLRAAG